MKIFGYFDPLGFARIKAKVICKNLPQRDIRFLVDTGAYRTTILNIDAERLGIDYSRLYKKEEGAIGIGGTADTYILEDVKLLFATETGIHLEDLKTINVIMIETDDEYKIKKLPSLLGIDVLNKYKLFVDKTNNQVLLTDEKIIGDFEDDCILFSM